MFAGADGAGATGRAQHFHKVFTYNYIAKLSQTAPVWVLIPSFDHTTQLPEQRLMTGAALLELFERRQLCPATLLVGLQARTSLPLHASFFRPLELLLELLDANLPYIPLTAEDADRRTTPPDWCQPMQVLVAAAAATAAAVAVGKAKYGRSLPSSEPPSLAGGGGGGGGRGPSSQNGFGSCTNNSIGGGGSGGGGGVSGADGDEQQQRQGQDGAGGGGGGGGGGLGDSSPPPPPGRVATSSSRTTAELLRSAQYWCFVHYYTGGDIKCVMNDPPSTMLQRLQANRLSDFTPVIGLAEKKDFHVFIRACLFMPLAALLQLLRDAGPCPLATNAQLTAFDQRGLRVALAPPPPPPPPPPATASQGTAAAGSGGGGAGGGMGTGTGIGIGAGPAAAAAAVGANALTGGLVVRGMGLGLASGLGPWAPGPWGSQLLYGGGLLPPPPPVGSGGGGLRAVPGSTGGVLSRPGSSTGFNVGSSLGGVVGGIGGGGGGIPGGAGLLLPALTATSPPPAHLTPFREDAAAMYGMVMLDEYCSVVSAPYFEYLPYMGPYGQQSPISPVYSHHRTASSAGSWRSGGGSGAALVDGQSPSGSNTSTAASGGGGGGVVKGLQNSFANAGGRPVNNNQGMRSPGASAPTSPNNTAFGGVTGGSSTDSGTTAAAGGGTASGAVPSTPAPPPQLNGPAIGHSGVIPVGDGGDGAPLSRGQGVIQRVGVGSAGTGSATQSPGASPRLRVSLSSLTSLHLPASGDGATDASSGGGGGNGGGGSGDTAHSVMSWIGSATSGSGTSTRISTGRANLSLLAGGLSETAAAASAAASETAAVGSGHGLVASVSDSALMSYLGSGPGASTAPGLAGESFWSISPAAAGPLTSDTSTNLATSMTESLAGLGGIATVTATPVPSPLLGVSAFSLYGRGGGGGDGMSEVTGKMFSTSVSCGGGRGVDGRLAAASSPIAFHSGLSCGAAGDGAGGGSFLAASMNADPGVDLEVSRVAISRCGLDRSTTGIGPSGPLGEDDGDENEGSEQTAPRAAGTDGAGGGGFRYRMGGEGVGGGVTGGTTGASTSGGAAPSGGGGTSLGRALGFGGGGGGGAGPPAPPQPPPTMSFFMPRGAGVRQWESPAFRLFTCDSATEPFAARWWFLDAGGAVQGPFTAEQMVVFYFSGLIGDSTLVCGTEPAVVAPLAPPRYWFEGLALLLQAAGQGCRYRLLTAAECEEAALPRTRLELPSTGAGGAAAAAAAAAAVAAAGAAAGALAGRAVGAGIVSGGALSRRSWSHGGGGGITPTSIRGSLGGVVQPMSPASGGGGTLALSQPSFPETPSPGTRLGGAGGQYGNSGASGGRGGLYGGAGRTWSSVAAFEDTGAATRGTGGVSGAGGVEQLRQGQTRGGVSGTGAVGRQATMPSSTAITAVPAATVAEYGQSATTPSPGMPGGGGRGSPGSITYTTSSLSASGGAAAGTAARAVARGGVGSGGGGGGEVEVGTGCSDEDAVVMLGANLSREVGIDEQLAALPESLGIGDIPQSEVVRGPGSSRGGTTIGAGGGEGGGGEVGGGRGGVAGRVGGRRREGGGSVG